MVKGFIKNLIMLFIISLICCSAFAEDATVLYVKGKVEVQRDNKWVQINQGDKLYKSDLISTGFQSEAKIKMFDSLLYMGPLSRIAIEELATSADKDNVNLYLKTGQVRSQVNHTENKRVAYQVHTAVAVASVRGTDFIYGCDNRVICFKGAVAVALLKTLNSKAAANMSQSMNVPDDGCVIKENETITMDENSLTNAPVNNTTLAATSVVSAVSTAASQEAVSAAGSSGEITSVNATSSSSGANSAPSQVEVSVYLNE